ERNGAVGEVKVVRSAEESLDAEAVRVIKTLPKFFPAREGGETVAVWYTLPVTFTLSSDESDD
ncbi:MAG: TonB family protein, partial [Muribaculaceae bacterium]|nr:TonB family protein [Muribaculaceae bacterium]